MTGDFVSRTGATVRTTERAVSTTSPMRSNGWRAASQADGNIPLSPSTASTPRDQAWPAQPRSIAPVPRGSGSGAAAASAGATASRSRSKRRSASSIPPTPSVSEWCSFMTSAARSPSRCSTSVNSHSGWAGSNAAIAALRAIVRTVPGVWGSGESTRRKCQLRSKPSSTVQRGVASRAGGTTTFLRKDGTSRVTRSSRATSVSQSGRPSSHATTTTVDRSAGSRSMYQVNASLSRMKTSMTPPFTSLTAPSPLCSRRGREGKGRRSNA